MWRVLHKTAKATLVSSGGSPSLYCCQHATARPPSPRSRDAPHGKRGPRRVSSVWQIGHCPPYLGLARLRFRHSPNSPPGRRDVVDRLGPFCCRLAVRGRGPCAAVTHDPPPRPPVGTATLGLRHRPSLFRWCCWWRRRRWGGGGEPTAHRPPARCVHETAGVGKKYHRETVETVSTARGRGSEGAPSCNYSCIVTTAENTVITTPHSQLRVIRKPYL